MALQPGDAAPEFELLDQEGRPVRLSSFRGQRLVLFFYPKDNTPVCTKESCTFRDHYDAFKEVGAEVMGISSDGVDSHARFANKYELPYPVLSDRGRAVARAFGVPQRLGLLPARMTFVLDEAGVVRHVTHAELSAEKHVQEALQALKQLPAA